MQEERKNTWQRLSRAFDATFFRMTFRFLAIVFVGFALLIAIGAYEAGKKGVAQTATPDVFVR